jgi:hypothetical protein
MTSVQARTWPIKFEQLMEDSALTPTWPIRFQQLMIISVQARTWLIRFQQLIMISAQARTWPVRIVTVPVQAPTLPFKSHQLMMISAQAPTWPIRSSRGTWTRSYSEPGTQVSSYVNCNKNTFLCTISKSESQPSACENVTKSIQSLGTIWPAKDHYFVKHSLRRYVVMLWYTFTGTHFLVWKSALNL